MLALYKACYKYATSTAMCYNMLTLWDLRVFWGPGNVLMCPDICV